MTTSQMTPARSPAPLRRLGCLIGTALSGFARGRAVGATARVNVEDLRHLGDHLLRDIGIERDQVEAVASAPRVTGLR